MILQIIREVPNFKNVIDDFRSSLIELVRKLLYGFALYLDLEDKELFLKKHRAILEDFSIKSHTFIRTNYYFPMEVNFEMKEKEQLRLAEHCDIDTLSFLFQDQTGGLEAKMPNGDWFPVPPIKDSIVLNLGYMMEVWAGGNLPATVRWL